MKRIRTTTLLVFLSVFLPQVNFYAQSSGENRELYSWFDKVVGRENTDLLNGIEYIEPHLTINEKHKYLNTSKFIPGMVVYEGEPYYEVDMRYNVYDDLLIVKVNKRVGEATLQLHKEEISAFNLAGRQFINTGSNNEEEEEIQGFYEVLSENNQFKVLKKHRKKIRKRLDNSYVYFEFEPREPEYAFSYAGNFYPLKSERNLSRVLPEREDEIDNYYRSNRNVLRSNPELFYNNLFQKLSETNSSAR